MPCEWYFYSYFNSLKIIIIKAIGALWEDRLKFYGLFFGKSKFACIKNNMICGFGNLFTSAKGLGTQF